MYICRCSSLRSGHKSLHFCTGCLHRGNLTRGIQGRRIWGEHGEIIASQNFFLIFTKTWPWSPEDHEKSERAPAICGVIGHWCTGEIDSTTFHPRQQCRKMNVLAIFSRIFGLLSLRQVKDVVMSNGSFLHEKRTWGLKANQTLDDFWMNV